MTLERAKKLKIGDRVGSRLHDEDGIIVGIIENEEAKSTETLLFSIAFETYGVITVKYRDINNRCLCEGNCDFDIFDVLEGLDDGEMSDYYNYENSLRCPIVKKLKITDISNEELFKLWKREDLIKYLK